jgi:pimeloyl-ACP methyl ester carboxylesterase
VIVVAAASLPGTASPLQVVTSQEKGLCSSGATGAVIAGKRTCLSAGRSCKTKFDRQYHRHGFSCYRGRLRRLSTSNGTPLVVRRIDLGGYRLAIRCQGKGSPTVVLESGFDTGGEQWLLVQSRLAKATRVCSYDRAGVGASDRRVPDTPPRVDRVVDELHTLLSRAGIPGPYVLGGHSIGAFFIRLFTLRYPNEVAALVTVDGSLGGLDPAPAGSDLVQGNYEAYYIAAANNALAANPTLGSRPLVVLTRGKPELSGDVESYWLRGQVRVARFSTDSLLVRVDNAGHDIPGDNPGIVVQALRLTVVAVRAGAPLPDCAATKLPGLAGTCLQ